MYAWQLKDWRNFKYDSGKLEEFEKEFLYLSGMFLGVQRVLDDESGHNIRITFLSDEAYKTSEIEGEILNRDSLQSSVQRYFDFK